MAPETMDLGDVVLRRPRATDAEAILSYGNDPEVARYADWPAGNTIDRIRESIRQRAERWESGEEFYWAITTLSDDRAIGGISCRVAGNAAEVGFLLDPAFWGNGIATRACRAVAEWVLGLPNVLRVWATCDFENRASMRVLEKAGLSREGVSPHAVIRPNIGPDPRDAIVYARVQGAA